MEDANPIFHKVGMIFYVRFNMGEEEYVVQTRPLKRDLEVDPSPEKIAFLRWVERDEMILVVRIKKILNDYTRLYGTYKPSCWDFRLGKQITSQSMVLVFGSSMTGVYPFGFNSVMKSGFFKSGVSQTLEIYGTASSSKIRATFQGLGPTGLGQLAMAFQYMFMKRINRDFWSGNQSQDK
jgi:hypothetical protein